MAKRFSRMKWASQANLTGAALDKYKAYRAGSSEVKYPRSPDSMPGPLVPVYLRPFGVGADDIYQAKASDRAIGKISDLINSPALFQHKQKPTGDALAIVSATFRPAKAIITKAGSGSSEKFSKVTGLPYKAKAGAATYTIPFGATGTEIKTARYGPACKEIKASVEQKDSDYAVTFTPEYF